MKLEVYAVHDAAVGAFVQPLFFRSRGEAVRSFQDAVTDGKMQFAAHPKDYSFWFIGIFDDQTGRFEPDLLQDRVCGALDFQLPPAS